MVSRSPALWVLVLVGGIVGTALRIGAGNAIPTGQLPWPTLVVNVVGSFGLGWLVARHPRRTRLQAFAGVGVLGSLTTFSTFVAEATTLAESSGSQLAAYLLISLVVGVAAAVTGLRIGTESH